ncbi:MAG: hypothetical protein WC775_05280 [Patescibacteria group bacterium]|jgi:hypothetical protein
MNNILLVSSTKDAADKYLTEYRRLEKIPESSFTHIEPEKNGYTVEQIGQLIELVSHRFNHDAVFVLWEFATAKEVVQNAFLKTLEEHAEHIVFILVVPSITSVMPTILSRSLVAYARGEQLLLSPEDTVIIESFIEKVRKKGTLASTLVNYSPTKKREEIPSFLNKFITYGYGALGRKDSSTPWLADKLKKTMEALPLITRNFIDSEAVLDNIFLS